MVSVLVTGAAGFIGSVLVDSLLARGDTVVGLDTFDPHYDPASKELNLREALARPRFSLLRVDVRDSARLASVFAEHRPSVVVHLAAAVGARASLADPVRYQEVNVGGTQVLLESARRAGISHLVLASSSTVYGASDGPMRENDAAEEPTSPYAASKRASELLASLYAHSYGVPTTVLRIFTTFGPRQRPDLAIASFTRLIEAGQPVPIHADGNASRDLVFVDDVVAALLAAVDRPLPFATINVGSGQETGLREAAIQLASELGKPVELAPRPSQVGDPDRSLADVTRASELLSWTPGVPFPEGIRRYVAWYRSRSTMGNRQ